jgi:hypothetical protein
MQDISAQLSELIIDKKCSSLLAFIMVENGLRIQEPKSDKESGGRLRDTWDINSDE